jgi:transcriptional regulator with XRE-family HTH domain
MTCQEVRQWRTRHKWTQQEAAQYLNIPLSTYKQREYGRREVPGMMVVAMAGLDLQYPV